MSSFSNVLNSELDLKTFALFFYFQICCAILAGVLQLILNHDEIMFS